MYFLNVPLTILRIIKVYIFFFLYFIIIFNRNALKSIYRRTMEIRNGNRETFRSRLGRELRLKIHELDEV